MKRTLMILLALFCSWPEPALAGPWTPAPFHGYAKVWTKWLPGFGFYRGSGEVVEYGPYHEISLNAYGELGVAKGLAVWLHAPLLQVFSLGDPRPGQGSSTHASVGDPAFGLRWRPLVIGRFVGAISAGLRVPLAKSAPVQTVYSTSLGNAKVGELKVGSGVFDVPLSVLFGYGGERFHLAAAGGYRYRSGGFAHDLLWSAEAGLRFWSRFNALLRLSGVHPLEMGSTPRDESPSGIGNGTAYVAFALEGGYQLDDHFSVGASLEGGLFRVRRQTGGPVISIFAAMAF